MASSWVNVDMAQAIPVGDYRVVTLATTEVAVINVDGKFYAIEDICTHDYSGLTGGDICGREIICPRHGAGFDICTGQVLAPPAYEDIATFPTRVHEGTVQVRDNRND